MDVWRNNSLSLPADRRTAVILGGSVALHVVALTLLGLNLAGRYDPAPIASDIPLYLDLEPWPELSRSSRRTSVQPQAPASLPIVATPRAVRPADEPPPAVTAPTPPASDPGPQRPAPAAPTESPSAWRGDVCRDLSNFAAWNAANCAQRGPAQRAEARGSPPAADAHAVEARIGQRHRNASEQRREEGFASQAAANDAWRAYTRGEGDYPGLRSLFTQH